jgi:hypothetical protein
LHELVDLASAVEQRIIRMAMQVDERHRAQRLLARGRLFLEGTFYFTPCLGKCSHGFRG